MRPVLGIHEQMVENINARLSSGTIGKFYGGNFIDGEMNGLNCGFNNVNLIDYDTTSGLAESKVTATIVAATYPIGTPHYYLLGGVSGGHLRAAVSAGTDDGVPATNGIFAASDDTTNMKSVRGVFRFQLGDVDGASSSMLDQAGDLWLPVSTYQDFEIHFGIANHLNFDQLATVGFAQIGVCSGALDDDSANDPSTYFACFQIAASGITPKTETTSLNAHKLPSSEVFDLGIRYVASAGKFYFTLNGQAIGGSDGGIAAHASMTSAQVFVRVCHLAAYTALTDSALKLELDYVTANTSLME